MNSTARIQLMAIAASASLAVAASTPLDPFTASQQLAFEYRVTVEQPEAEVVRLWLPYPGNDAEQTVQGHEIKPSVALRQQGRLTREPRYGNQMLYFEIGRDEFPASGSVAINVHYQVERRPVAATSLAEAAGRADLDAALYAGANPWLKSNDTIRDMAREATANTATETARVRALYDFVYDLMQYDKQGEGWGHGDPIWACTAKRGNCTDFHSLYIALAREVGITARFEIGIPIPSQVDEGEIPGYHCWARVLDTQLGWLPFDASEAKKAGRRDAYFGRIPSDRIAFSVGRDLILSPAQHGAGLNYFIYPYAEADDAVYDKVKASFHFRRL